MSKKQVYNHAYTIAFSLESENADGIETHEVLREALQKRINELWDSDELIESIGCPFDTYEVD